MGATGPRGGARAAPGGFPARARRANARGAMAAATAQLAANSRRGSRTLVVDGFPNGYGALTGRPDRAAERRRPGGFSGVSAGGRGARVEAAIAQLARAAGRGTLARVCSHFPERLGAVTAAATGRGRAAGPRRPHRGAVRIGRPAMAQLARAAGWGSLIWVVNDSPNGYGALTGRPGRAASVRRPGGFSGVSPERPRARVAAAIAHLGRAEGTGRSVRTPCAFPSRGRMGQ